MNISPVSPLGPSSNYPQLRAEKAPGETAVPEQGKPIEDVFNKQSADQSIRSGDDQVQTYGYTAQITGTEKSVKADGEEASQDAGSDQKNSESTSSSKAEPKKNDAEYTPEEQKEITELKSRDTEVKAHEQAHIAAGGQYVRGVAHFEYQTGPDGKKYAIGGEVSIDASKESGDPQATISKMQTIIRAAMAPASPSGQDRAVAAKATRIEMEARTEAMEQTQAEAKGKSKQTDTESTTQNRSAGAYPASMDTPPTQPHIDLYS